MDRHGFTPSRPDGVVCVAERGQTINLAGQEVCGYPAGHPIHDVPPAGAVPTGRALALRTLLLQLADMASELESPRRTAELIERIVNEYGKE